MKVLHRLNLAADIPYSSSINIGNLGDCEIFLSSKLILTDSVKQEYNFDSKLFFDDSLVKEFSWDFNCKDIKEANTRAKKVESKIVMLIKKSFINHFSSVVVKAIESIKP